MLNSRDPDLLSIDDVLVAAFDRCGLDLCGVGAGSRLGHGHRLQAQFAAGQFRQVIAFLRLISVTQQGEHVVHLPVNGAGVTAAAIHFFQDYRGFGQSEAGAAIFDRNHRCQPTCVGQRLDEGFGKALFFVDFTPVSRIEFSAKSAYALADGIEFVRVAVSHYCSPQRVTHDNCPA
ncbi:hypothetical protein D3C71_1269120 [compost metagenome]